MEISTFYTPVKYISVTKYAIETIGPMWAIDPKIHLFPLRHVDPHLIHECLGCPIHHPK